MIRNARVFLCSLLSLTLIAGGAETQRKRTRSASTKEATPSPSKTKMAPSAKSQDRAESQPKSANADDNSPATDAEELAGKIMGPVVVTLSPDQLAEFDQQPAWIQSLIRDALALTGRNIGYLFGSADPQAGGMDCSGTIYYLLQESGYKDVPRDSGGQYGWLQSKGTLRVLPDGSSFDPRALRPGDLLFWTGTYSVTREFPISHVMLFLGTEKASGKPVMWGASDGRTYGGKQCYGVSVFDFQVPKPESKAKFVAFGQLPVPTKR